MKKIKFILHILASCLLLANIAVLSCRDQPEEDKILYDSIKFDKNNIKMKVSEEVSIKITATPAGGKKNEQIEYTVSQEGIVIIKGQSNDGFIIEALNPGILVIMAKAKNVTAYFEMQVEGVEYVGKPYIMVTNPVIELNEGEMRNLQVSLYGGTVLDNNEFQYFLEDGKDSITIDTTMNSIVIHGNKRGNQKIKIKHPKADNDNEILVFVKAVNEQIRYITSEKNVMMIDVDNQYHHLTVTLFGGTPVDRNNFQFQIVEGQNIIDIASNNEVCNIKANQEGMAVIRVYHPLAVMDFDIRIITYTAKTPVILLDKTFVIMDVNGNAIINANVENPKTVNALNEFTYELPDDNGSIVVTQANNQFFVQAEKGGNQRIIISNKQAHYSRETLIVVRTEIIYRDDYYITTSQNIIQTQVGGEDIPLYMLLVGGVIADANGFSWVVENGTLIDVETPHGKVDYKQRKQLTDVFNAVAYITPKRSGTTRIVISHPKSESSTTVFVKVYPKNTFSGTPIIVKTEGLLKVLKDGNLPVTLEMVSGKAEEIGLIDWNIANKQYAEVNEQIHNLTNLIIGKASGLTKMTVSGGNLRDPHESLVLVGTQAEIDMASLIYVDSIYQRVATEQVVRLPVRDSKGIYGDSTEFKAITEKPEIIYSVMLKNQLVFQGKQPGETTVTIRHPAATNEIVLHIKVEPANLTIDKPYYITGPEIVGFVKGRTETITVNLDGAPVYELGDMEWAVDDSKVISIIGNGKTAAVTGLANEGQTNVRVRHKKSQNEKTIVVYVVENENDLKNKVIISVEKNNYLMIKSEEQFIRLITNANDTDKTKIIWSVKYGSDIIALNSQFDSAMITALQTTGNAEIVISHEKNIIPLSLFVSVVDAKPESKYISGPSIIELLVGESKIVPVTSANLSTVEISNIRWSIEDTNIANIQENGESAYILGLSKGISYVNVKQQQLGFLQRITLLCANTKEELESMYIMGTDMTYYTMSVGEEKKIRLDFGSAGFPEGDRKNIRWIPDTNNVARVAGSREQTCIINGKEVLREAGNGEQASIIAANPGKTNVIVQSPVSFNELIITFEVSGKAISKYEFRNYEQLKGILIGKSSAITMKLYQGNAEITSGYSQLFFENEKESVIGVDLAGNVLSITAKSGGQSFITVSHPDAAENARILVYTAATQEELDNYYPIAAEKTNFLIEVGETAQLRLITDPAKDAANMGEIQWGIVNSSVIDTPVFVNKKNATIKGRYVGDCIFNITFKGNIVEKIYVSVVDHSNIDFNKRINTENIIGLVKGKSKITTISSNLSGTEIASIIWESENNSLVTVSGTGASATITASETPPANRETYVTVKYGSWLKRNILVYVCDTEEQLKSYKAMNMENQYQRMSKGETLILPAYFAPNKPDTETSWKDKYGNSVVKFNSLENGGKIEVTGLNEGVAVLQASNDGLSNTARQMEIYIEVSNRYANIVREPELKYLTANKVIYVLNPDQPEMPVEIQVTGIGLSPQELLGIKWEKSNNYISIFPNGDKCKVLPNGAGETMIRVSHPACNILEIKIIVSRDAVVEGVPHIIFDDIVRLGLNEVKNLPVSIAGAVNADNSKYVITSDNPNIEAKRTGNLITLTGKNAGQSKLSISHPDSGFDKEVIVVVTTNPDGLIYFTTSDNFSVVKRNEFKNVKVELIGYDEKNNDNIEWSVAPGYEDIVRISGNGLQGQVQGLKIGTAKIDVKHKPNYAIGNISIYVRVSETDIIPPYITTSQNIVSVVQGNSMNLQVSLVNGKPDEMYLFKWVNEAPEILNVNFAGNSALVQGKTPGVGRIKVMHAACFNSIEIIVVIENDNSSSGIYITTDNMLVEMKPNEQSRKIDVRLVGGNMEDIYGFKWEIANQNSIERWPDGTSKTVIDITPGADSAYVAAKNEGEAVIRVSHPKTNYRLEIKVDVKFNSRITFQKREVIMNMGETASVEVGSPTGGKVIYESSDKSILTVSGTNKICIIEAKKDGVAIVTARNPTGTLSDEIVVQVKFVSNAKVRYIETSAAFFTMNTTSERQVNLQATVVGKKDDGNDFMEEDNNDLKWTIAEGHKYISLFPSYGKNIVVTAVNAGNVVLHIEHPKIPGYVKRMYIMVELEDIIFKLDKSFINMSTEGQDKQTSVICSLQNSPDTNWQEKITWENMNPELFTMMTSGDNKYVTLVAWKTGEGSIRCIYNGVSARVCNVVVEAPKYLNIISNMSILPGQVETITYDVMPPNTDVIVSTDHYDLLEVIHNKESHSLTLKAKNGEGFTMITLTANKIQKIVTVNTTNNYLFRLIDQASIRGRPYLANNGVYTVRYDINPQGNRVTQLYPQLSKDYMDVIVNSSLQNIIIQPNKAGYSELQFEADFYKGQGDKILKLPVYLYYDIINFEFKVYKALRVAGGTAYSRIDLSQNAIFLGDGETLRIYANIDNNLYPQNGFSYGHAAQAGGQGGASTVLSLQSGTGSPRFTELNNSLNLTVNPQTNSDASNNMFKYLELSVNSAQLKSNFTYDSLKESVYAGLLTINYNYYNGNQYPANLSKTYMLFIQLYNRVQP
jgi:hypothetical protein